MNRVDALLSREVVIGLAVLGGVASTLASWLQGRFADAARYAQQLNYLGYGCMTLSMVFFIAAGFRS